uniref:Uncharacterized protein n=1 Tax=Myotis myotis TaxID=51298 RepID=A0A7J7SQW0_MYOMY|nr:hypothetical protein mMyoMyo1_005589 [Myotis myotis]
MAAKAASSEPTTPWSCHPGYARYRQHYSKAMAWVRSHQNADGKAGETYFRPQWYFTPGDLPPEKRGPPRSCCGHRLASQDSLCGYSHSPRSGQHPHGSTGEDHAWATEEEPETVHGKSGGAAAAGRAAPAGLCEADRDLT